MRMTEKRTSVLLLLLALCLTAFAYAPALDAGFYFDDLANIVDAPGIHWTKVSAPNLEALVSEVVLPSRPVANLTFALNHLQGGLAPRGYHVVNILIHLATGLVVAWTALLVLETGNPARRNGTLLAAAAAATLFLVHPLNTQAVTYVVQRMAVLAALLSLLAFCFYLKGRRCPQPGRAAGWYTLGLASWGLGVGSKETAIALPLVIVAYEACFHRPFWKERLAALRERPWQVKTGVVMAMALVPVSGLILVNAYVDLSTLSLTERLPGRDFNAAERMLTQLRVQLFYLQLLLWPAPSLLNLDHEFTISRGILDPPATVVCLVFWVAAAAGSVFLAARRPRLGFPLLAYLALHLIESGPLNLELVFEHRMYFPMAALAWLVACSLADLPDARRRVALTAVGIAALILSGLTLSRNRVWADPVAFHYDTVRKSPGKFRPQYNLGTVLGTQGRIAEAIPHLERAVALDPEHSAARNQLANTLVLTSRPREAVVHYRKAVSLQPDNVAAVYNLASILDREGEHEEAIEHYRNFVSKAPPGLAPQIAISRERIRALSTRVSPQ